MKEITNELEVLNTRKPRRLNAFQKYLQREKYLLLLSLPGLLVLLLFKYLPMYGVIISFMDYRPGIRLSDTSWVGFKHFVEFIEDPYLFRIVKNTFTLGIYTLIFIFPAPILLALVLNEVRWTVFKRITQTISYLPYFVSTVVIVGIVRLAFSMDGGMINTLLGKFGIEPIGFLIDSEWFRSLYIASGVWQTAGFGAIIYLAALSSVDMEMYEAAKIDGANRWQMLTRITIPSIVPTIIIMFILSIGSILGNDFTKILLLYYPGNYDTADVISTYVYRQAFESSNVSYAAAIGLMNSIVSAFFLVSANYISRKSTENSLW